VITRPNRQQSSPSPKVTDAVDARVKASDSMRSVKRIESLLFEARQRLRQWR
jgi:hypothetical protein